MTILRDVPLPNGAVAIRVAVTRLPDMPGWSKVETRGGPDCGLSVEDLDPRELHEPREVRRAALGIALHMLGTPRGTRNVVIHFVDIAGPVVSGARH